MEFHLLGDIAVLDPYGAPLAIPGARPKMLLALLLLHAPSWVSSGRILDELWTGGAPAKDPVAALHTAVAKLRRGLRPHGGELLHTGRAGYRLDLAEHTLDIRSLEAELSHARSVPEPDQRAALLRSALKRHPGIPLAGFEPLPFVQQERARLEALRLAALEDRADAELSVAARQSGVGAFTDPYDLVAALRTGVREEPGRERLHALLIRALQLCGRQTEALEAYQQVRVGLRDRLGIEPGPELRAAQRAVLRGIETPPMAAVTAHDSAEPRESFIGRRHELDDLKTKLTTSRLVTLVGAGGIGKTSLALAAAAWEREAGATVWWTDLVPCTPDDVPAAVGAAAGVGPGSLPAELLVERLTASVGRARHPLLLLDNCEHVLAACADLVVRLLDSHPGLRILATSRERLGAAGEAVVVLRPMTEPDAAALFLARLAWLSPRAAEAATPDDITAVCNAVDRLPLGIELVAAKAGSAPIPAIVDQIGSRRGMLEVRLRSADFRHDTLRAAVDWSFRLLAPEEQAALRALSVFSTAFTPGAADAVAGPGTADILADLADKSLLVFEPEVNLSRYRMLVPVRQYARAALAASGDEEAILHRHGTWVACLADRAADRIRSGGAGEAFAAVTAAFPEVTAALDWLQSGTDPARLELASRAATRLSLYWLASGRREEGHRRLVRALETTTDASPWYAEALAWCAWLGTNARQAEMSSHADLLRRALAAAEARGDAAALTLVGALALTTHLRCERPDEARAVAERTEGALDDRHHRWETGVWQLFHSELLVTGDDPEAALKSAVTARETLTGLDPHSAATAHIMTGIAHERLGRSGTAVHYWRAAYDELTMIGAEHEAAYVLAILACAAAGDHDWPTAMSTADDLAQYAADSGERYLQATADTIHALAARARGDVKVAERLHRTAVERYTAAQRPECAAHDLAMLARLAAEAGDLVLAQVRAEQALRDARESGRPQSEILPLRCLIPLREDHPDNPALRTRLAELTAGPALHRTTECPFHLAVTALD
ncbi:ATP-binding protein [Streptomyces sp. NBC_01465]|uniref:ATP-binding protein n=1 Tax=Streptomyces sp. NBC_01465 TaxID=2903878 RepID=UPI002E369FA1|nr:BTAD domain-containing putative transcriptional regulator [Streptomyces sp. NBC_01465]